jgi:septum formation protein
MKKLILASTSKYRKQLLERLGVPFECIAPNVDEDRYKNQIPDPRELAITLGRLKAQAVSQKFPDAIVIGSDQLAHKDGTILSKPGNMDNAINQLRFLNGSTHELITAVTVIADKQELNIVNTTKLSMKPLTDEQIKKYLSQDKPFDCAGTYKLELKGISLFDRIESEDHTAIIGLPLIETGKVLNQLGMTIPPSD